ncbi:conjugal transfer protein TraD [Legionella erythra]|uniref:Protein TraD n=1 Tax=Legionella erythra TaxID=448 RepID=A0A0W0TQN8_LEGER|nr:conjugal transfer protein TraD [Legionella erythra]KTC97872.1 protein TraD [Legionella erythra]HEM0351370.1 conjugal transfer protein TraD [Legionella pneumophila]
MSTKTKIQKQQQLIARCEKSLALEKLKKRRADTRRKIELGGLVIKSGMDGFSKAVILGGLEYLQKLLSIDPDTKKLFETNGNYLFYQRYKINPSKNL